jgi:hypothetical protein
LDLEEFTVRMLGATSDARAVWLLSSRGRDRAALVRLDVATGAETLVHGDERLDVEWVAISDRTGEPVAAFTYPGRQAIHFLDRALGADVERVRRETALAGLYLVNHDDDERLLTVELFTEKGPEHWLIDRRRGERRLLGRHPILAFADGLSLTEPIELTARDGVRPGTGARSGSSRSGSTRARCTTTSSTPCSGRCSAASRTRRGWPSTAAATAATRRWWG